MRKITFTLAIIGMMILQSCTVNDVPQTPVQQVNNNNTVIGSVFEVTRTFSTNNGFSSLITFQTPIYSSDMVLVYRLDDVYNGTDVWKLLPQTYFTNNGLLDFRYDFDFTRYDVSIFMDGFDLAGIQPQYRNNQVFRILVIPADFNRNATASDMSYEAVIQKYNLQNTPIQKMN